MFPAFVQQQSQYGHTQSQYGMSQGQNSIPQSQDKPPQMKAQESTPLEAGSSDPQFRQYKSYELHFKINLNLTRNSVLGTIA